MPEPQLGREGRNLREGESGAECSEPALVHGTISRSQPSAIAAITTAVTKARITRRSFTRWPPGMEGRAGFIDLGR